MSAKRTPPRAIEGRLKEDVSARGAANATIALMDGLQVQWLLQPGAVDMSERLRSMLRRVTSINF